MKIQCPECNQKYEIEDHFQGSTVNCVACGNAFTISDRRQTPNIPKFNLKETLKAIVDTFTGLLTIAAAAILILTVIAIAILGINSIVNGNTPLDIFQGIGIILIDIFILLAAITVKIFTSSKL